MIKKLTILTVIFLSLFFMQTETQAGFGISPPYVKSKNPIFPGAHYEQKITLLRSSVDTDLQAKISVNAPEIADWFSFDQGDLIELPKGKYQVPMIVKVDVPSDAEIGDYKGYINIQIMPKGGGGGVSIALGARVDIDLTITNETFLDFLVRKVTIPNFEKLKKPWSYKLFSWFFYRIKVDMTVENTGNIDVAPSRVHIDVYDLTETTLLESHDDRSIKKIKPFQTEKTVATFPTDLAPGQYWGKIKIYKEKEIIHKNKISFTVGKPGELLKENRLGPWPYIMMGGLIMFVLMIIFALIRVKIWRHIFKILYILSWPLRFSYKKIKQFINAIKMKFWRWMHRKSSEHQEDTVKKNETDDKTDD